MLVESYQIVKPNLRHLCKNYHMALHDRINEMLTEKNVRKVDLAKATKSPRATITDWTSGKTKVLTYEKLKLAAQFFGVNPDWLNTGKGPKYPVSAHKHQIDAALKTAVQAAEYEKSYLDEMIKLCDRIIEQQAFPVGQDLELYQLADRIVDDYKQEHGGDYPTLSTLEFLLGKEIKKRQSN
jgi:transcriptional regulator with XRE-family HTH domain